MAYYIDSLLYSNRHLPESRYTTFMVAEHAFNDPRADDKFIGDLMPVDFDPMDVERRIKAEIVNTFAESQAQVKLEMMASIDGLNGKLTGDIAALNAKVDAIKAAQDVNDDYVKQTVEGNISKIWEALNFITDGINQMTVKIASIENSSPPGLNTAGGINTTATTTGHVKSIMENKAIQNLEKLTNAPSDWMIWQLRLKNALTQVDEIYEYIIDASETIIRPISTFENWNWLIAPNIAAGCGKTQTEINKLKRDLYSVLVDKCTSTQVLAFENDEKDGIYAYFSLYRGFRLTAGLGQIEKREFLTRPPTAKNETEVYDCIIAWEREVKEQEKLVPAAQRPILSKTIKGAVLKNIAVGNIREYIKTHEAIKDYETLREEVLQMAMFNRTEHNVQAQKPMPMDLNAVIDKLRSQFEQPIVKKEESDFNFGSYDGKGPGNQIKSELPSSMSDINKFVEEINAMMKGKGKGKGSVTCFNCGKTGHYAKDCWSAKGKGDQKGYQGKGQALWSPKGDVKGGGNG